MAGRVSAMGGDMRLDRAYHLLGEEGGMGLQGGRSKVPKGMTAIAGAGAGAEEYVVAVPDAALANVEKRVTLEQAARAIVEAWALEHAMARPKS